MVVSALYLYSVLSCFQAGGLTIVYVLSQCIFSLYTSLANLTALQVWTIAENVLSKQPSTANKVWPFNLGLGGSNNFTLRYGTSCCNGPRP
jgi:hypothetical protein